MGFYRGIETFKFVGMSMFSYFSFFGVYKTGFYLNLCTNKNLPKYQHKCNSNPSPQWTLWKKSHILLITFFQLVESRGIKEGRKDTDTQNII